MKELKLNWEFLYLLEKAKINELKEFYKKNNYEIIQGQNEYDLIVREKKTEKIIVFEIKSYIKQKKEIEKLRVKKENALKQFPGCSFKLVIVRFPEEKEINVKGLDKILLNLINNEYKSELFRILSFDSIYEVNEISINSIELNKDDVLISGYASLYLLHKLADVFNENISFLSGAIPFDFTISMDRNLEEIKAQGVNLDLSEFIF